MSEETEIQLDMRALLIAALPSIAVYDKWATSDDPNPYITFGPMQAVQRHTKGYRLNAYYVAVHLFVRDPSGSIAARELGATIRDALDDSKLGTSGLVCYFEDSTSIYEDDDVTTHIVSNFRII